MEFCVIFKVCWIASFRKLETFKVNMLSSFGNHFPQPDTVKPKILETKSDKDCSCLTKIVTLRLLIINQSILDRFFRNIVTSKHILNFGNYLF